MKTSMKPMLRPSSVEGHAGSIVYRLTHLRVTRFITTDCKLFPSEWNEERASVRLANPERAPIVRKVSQRMQWDMERLSRIIRNLESQPYDYTTDDVVREYQRVVREHTLYNFMESFIHRLKQLNKVGTAKNYQASLNSIKRFLKGEDIFIESINEALVEDYQAYLVSNNCAPNSISFYMRRFRAIYNRAVKQGLTDDRKPFSTVSTGSEKTRKRAISDAEVMRIIDHNFQRRPNLEWSRDVFLFLFFCRGMSFVDAAFLKKSDIQGSKLIYRRHKTNQELQVKIIEPVQTIIDRYTVADSPYLLPIIACPGVDERRQYESALHRVNHDLKEIGKMLKISIILTTYVSRHSWASIAKYKKISINIISDALGHDSIVTTQTYLDQIDSSIIDQANDLVLKDILNTKSR